jgi:hypothetical protein
VRFPASPGSPYPARFLPVPFPHGPGSWLFPCSGSAPGLSGEFSGATARALRFRSPRQSRPTSVTSRPSPATLPFPSNRLRQPQQHDDGNSSGSSGPCFRALAGPSAPRLPPAVTSAFLRLPPSHAAMPFMSTVSPSAVITWRRQLSSDPAFVLLSSGPCRPARSPTPSELQPSPPALAMSPSLSDTLPLRQPS